MEALESGKQLDKVFVKKDLQGDLARELSAMLREYEVPMMKVPVEKLNRITMKNHQGAIAMLSPVAYHKLDQIVPTLYEMGELPFIMLLDGITDTRNFGAIARTAECAGVHAIVIPARHSVSINADAVKTSAGALLHIPVCRVDSMVQAARYLSDAGLTLVAATEKSAEGYTKPDYTAPVAIVMGAEDTGISPEVLRECSERAAIPIRGSIGSLNVAVASGVIAYEVVRQRMESEN
jgi:23S rRNA (guanosine2251-2'-O)-methyltransferase